ncbi:hypothetical protein TNCV_2467661 [Trichonephila clavipes]|nr:hypothetical protein TNCV_2467661 [Trichonephila clavipes]
MRVGAWCLESTAEVKWGQVFLFRTGFGFMTNMVSLADSFFSYSMHQLLVHHLSGPQDDRAIVYKTLVDDFVQRLEGIASPYPYNTVTVQGSSG